MKQNVRNTMPRRSRSTLRILLICLATILLLVMTAVPALAETPTGTGGDIATSVLVLGTKKLINDASMTGMILAPIIAIGFIIYFFILKNAADEMDQKKWNSRIWTTLASVVGVELAGIIVSLVTKYYEFIPS